MCGLRKPGKDTDLAVISGSLYVSTVYNDKYDNHGNIEKPSWTRILESGTFHFGHGLQKEFLADSRRTA
jgi:hypothetical protein